MRIEAIECDPIVTLDNRFFTLGPLIMVDQVAGIIDYYEVDEKGNYLFDTALGIWRRARVSGTVRIYDNMGWC